MKKTLTFIFAFFAAFWAVGQEKCGSHTYEQELRAKYPYLGTVQDFENWLASKKSEYMSKRVKMANGRTGGGPFVIPVIIHVVYQTSQATIQNNSENIPYGQAISQIRVLNEDFNRTNADASNTRAIFQPVAGTFDDIEFVAATHDPNGVPLAEAGVERINGETTFNITIWTQTSCNNTLKPATIWDPEKYLNIWTVNFGSAGLFGYAQFPEGSSLPGMPTGTQTSSTDGVVINYRSIGSNYNADGTPVAGGPYITNPLAPGTDRGRTATHEIGHWIGLRHSWGDGNCGADDFCADTPWQNGDSPLTTNCASSQTRNTCTTVDTPFGVDAPDQIENYMDYSADVCMNMFTREQVDRMRIVLLNSPRRKELVGNTLLSIFGANVTGGIQGLQVTFTDRSGVTGTEPAITSWSWNFDAGTTPLGGVSQTTYTASSPGTANPPVITFNNVGTYRVTLTVTNGTKTDVSEMLIFVRQAPPPVLNAPSGLTVLNQQPIPNISNKFFVQDKVELQWNDNSNDEDNFVVTRRRANESVAQAVDIATLPPNTTTYTDEDDALNHQVVYVYRIRAVRNTQSALSNSREVEFRSTALSLNDTPLAREISVYPNPTQSSFSVDLSGLQVSNAKLQLHNTVGQMVAQKTSDNTRVSFDVQQLPKGMYLLKIETDKGSAVKRIVIQ